MDCVILSISYQNHQQKVTRRLRNLQRKTVHFQRKTMQYSCCQSVDIEQLVQHIVATSMQLVSHTRCSARS